MIKAIIFDFDGLILETEEPVFRSWQELFSEHGCELTLDYWLQLLGTSEGVFDPFDELERQLGREVDRAVLGPPRRERELELIAGQDLMPGVRAYLDEAERRGLLTAVASSSSQEWVAGHLDNLGIYDRFHCIKTKDDVEKAKPDPALFLLTLEELRVEPQEAMVLEDTPNGVLAAKRAGLFCVAVPNALINHLSFENADLRLGSLNDLSLEELLEKAESAPLDKS